MELSDNQGFTLIELLAVVAVLAILVCILVPAMRPPVIRASAAVDAENLKLLISEASADYMIGEDEAEGMIHFTAPDTFVVCGAPKARTEGFQDKPASVELDHETGIITTKYGIQDISYFAEIAKTGVIPDSAAPAEDLMLSAK